MESSHSAGKGWSQHSKKLKGKSSSRSATQQGSESEGSCDSNSVSGDSQNGAHAAGEHKAVTKKGDWEILTGLKQGERFEFTPSKFEGYLLKRRKWPLKGWHKRYFVLEDSILTYAKTAADLSRGKKHGSMDMSMSVISTKASRRRIDIDADTSIIHLKCKSRELYLQWVEQLKQHRLRKQHQLLYCTNSVLPGLLSPVSPSDDSPTDPLSAAVSLTGTLPASLPSSLPGTLVRDTMSPRGATGSGTLRPSILDHSILDDLTGDFAAANQTLHQLSKLYQGLLQQQENAAALTNTQAEPVTPSSVKTRRKFRLRKHKSSQKSCTASQDNAAPPSATAQVGASSLSSPPHLVHQSSLNTVNDWTSTHSEETNNQRLSTSSTVVSNLSELKPLSSSNPALSQTAHLPASPHPTTPHFFPPSAASSTSPPPRSAAQLNSTSTIDSMSTSTSLSSTTLAAPPYQSCDAPTPSVPSISVELRYSGSSNAQLNSSIAQDFTVLSKDLLSQLSTLYRSMAAERDRWHQQLEANNNAAVVATLRLHLNAALQQNTELRNRLGRIYSEADVSGLMPPSQGLPTIPDNVHRSLVQSMSYESSSCFSTSEYFDAPEAGRALHSGNEDEGGNVSDTSSDHSTAASGTTSDASDALTDAVTSSAEVEEKLSKCFTGRRTQLPAPRNTKEDFSLFNFLYKNIGKDLSKVSMPITINEPLNMLQRMCEELEYCELLDKAASLSDPAERMVQVAAFAVSAYASSIHRAGHKPFNPLLGETYECVREDKGFKFVAEQVSHHPPVSACHAQSPVFTLWQDVCIKTKFWGKSLEFQPSGKVHLTLNQHKDVYEWNKVTSCVHNLFGGGTRWVDQYGEAVIHNLTYKLTCKLTFVKASSWSSKRHEVFGTIVDEKGTVLHNLFGRWTEALYCGHAPSARVVWRPGSMPENSHLYYGFTRFAIELNEILPDMVSTLPPTDTRFRPDQKLLEEGHIDEAESCKQKLELQQRERRRMRETEGASHVPMWFRRDDTINDGDCWVFNGEYWNKRSDPGFVKMSFETLW